MVLLVALMLAVQLAPPFGRAEARAVELQPFTVETTVEVRVPAAAVLARPVGIAGELGPVALVDRGDGTWAGTVELTEIEDLAVVFELITPDGGSVRSAAATLTELGVDPVVFRLGPAAPLPRGSPAPGDATGVRWLGAGIVAGLSALFLVGIWASRRAGSEPPPEDAAGRMPGPRG